jgi:hypothetical protein
MVMDWKECLSKRIVKEVSQDTGMIVSMREIAALKVEAARVLPEGHHIIRTTLLYDALREYMEAIALTKGFRIYNHECYYAFLNQVMGLSEDAYEFDKLRRIRNGINYYGIKLDESEAAPIIKSLNRMIRKYRNF